jgi:hypothetical protein
MMVLGMPGIPRPRIAGDPAVLDTNVDATVAPTTSTWKEDEGGQGSSGLLDRCDRAFAVVGDGPPTGNWVMGATARLMRSRCARRGAGPAPASCLFGGVPCGSSDGSGVLISGCDRVDLGAGGEATWAR